MQGVGGGSLSLEGSRGEHLQGEREVFTTGPDPILSLHSGDNVIITHEKLLFTAREELTILLGHEGEEREKTMLVPIY